MNSANAPVSAPRDADLLRITLAALAVAIFSLAVFAADAWWARALQELLNVVVNATRLPEASALGWVFGGFSAIALSASVSLVYEVLHRQRSAFIAILFIYYAGAFGLAVASAKFAAGGLLSTTVLWSLAVPGGLSIMAAAAAVIFFTGIHELENDIVVDEWEEGEESPDHN